MPTEFRLHRGMIGDWVWKVHEWYHILYFLHPLDVRCRLFHPWKTLWNCSSDWFGKLFDIFQCHWSVQGYQENHIYSDSNLVWKTEKGNWCGLEISTNYVIWKQINEYLNTKHIYLAISVINRIYDREAFGKRRIAWKS